jgi:Tfp pilus assembly protein PilF
MEVRDMNRRIAMTFVLGAGVGLTGCQAPSFGGLAFWNKDNSSAGSTAPDVSNQKYSGLAAQFGGKSETPSVGMGAARPHDNDGPLMSSWKKTTGAISGAFATKSQPSLPENDPLRLDKMPKKIGAEVYVGAARLLENHGNFSEAEEKYREALRAEPKDLNALIGLARLHDRQGQAEKAIELYQKAAQAHPTSALVFNDLGLCHRRTRQLDKSLAAFRRAVDLQGDNAKYRNNLAGALVEAGRVDEAYKELAAVNPPAVAHYNLAHLLEQKSQRAAAIQHLQQALAIDANLTPARDMLNQFLPVSAASGAVEGGVSRAAASGSSGVHPASSQSAIASPVAQAGEVPSYHIGDESGSASVGLRPLPPID